MEKLKYDYFTDLNMNSVIIAKMPVGYKFVGGKTAVFLHNTNDGKWQVIVVSKHFGANYKQGSYFGEDVNPKMLGFSIRKDTVKVIYSVGSNLSNAKQAYRKMFLFCIKKEK